MTLSNIFKKDFLFKNALAIKAFFLDLIFPVECLGCGREGLWLCGACFRNVKLAENQFCLSCKKQNDFGTFCRHCAGGYSLDGVSVVCSGQGEELAQSAVKSLKYGFIKELSGELGRLMAMFIRNQLNKARIAESGKSKALPAILKNLNNNSIIPVPLHIRRKKWRGFNQSEEIAVVLGNYLGIPVDAVSLIKIRNTKAQAKLNKKEREKNVVGCFAWQGGDLAGRNVILVDDVATTGSTLNECARVLKASGAGEVWGLVLTNG